MSMSNSKANLAWFSVEEIGPNIKKSQKRYDWGIQLSQDPNERIFSIRLIHSVFSGRIRLLIEGQEVADTGRLGLFAKKFIYRFKIDSCVVCVKESRDDFYLKVNGESLHSKQKKLEEQEFLLEYFGKEKKQKEDFIEFTMAGCVKKEQGKLGKNQKEKENDEEVLDVLALGKNREKTMESSKGIFAEFHLDQNTPDK